eukprot:6648277-Prymnesium_polylepis.1
MAVSDPRPSTGAQSHAPRRPLTTLVQVLREPALLNCSDFNIMVLDAAELVFKDEAFNSVRRVEVARGITGQ